MSRPPDQITPLSHWRQPGRYSITADWVLPHEGPAIEHGVVVCQDGVVQEISDQHSTRADIELPGQVLMPALVNAHTHLEFSELTEPFPAGETFADWIRQVVAWRRQRDEDPSAHRRALEAGWLESQQAGVGLVGDIATDDLNSNSPFAPESCLRFLEFISLNPDDGAKQLRRANQFLEQTPASLAGLSPHAPYSVAFELVAELAQLAKRQAAPIAMHLAETEEELQLLSEQSGPLFEMLRDFGVWRPEAFSPKRSIVDYLRALAPAPQVLVIHGNYLNEEAIDYLANHKQFGVVYCPRTHEHFGHSSHPLPELLKRNIRVALGTDSRASNPDLSILEEARTVWRRFPQIDPQSILAMATGNGASLLKRPQSSNVGEFIAIEVAATSDPAAAILHS